MQIEHDVNSNRKHPIALVTDSIADLPKEFIDENQIHVFPLNIDIEGSTFLDKAGMNNEILFSIIDNLKTFPTSSQPSLKFG
jgi:fatty acid-binding protein DegV